MQKNASFLSIKTEIFTYYIFLWYNGYCIGEFFMSLVGKSTIKKLKIILMHKNKQDQETKPPRIPEIR